jgi:U3 small nucleolar RNA-associated protein MPP10
LPNSINQKYGNKKKQVLETLTGNKNVTIISNSSLNLPGRKKKKRHSANVISSSGGKV